jgi:hypothetical protein
MRFHINPKLALAGVIFVAIGVSADSCNQDPSTAMEHDQQEQLSYQAIKAVGMPAITKFSERRAFKEILEARDKFGPTYTYLYNAMQGTIGQKVCDSVGYGFSGATQYTNPSKVDWSTNHAVTIPQADPNGLYSPSETHGTWVLCRVPGTDTVAAQYIEPDVVTLTFPKENIKQP